MKTPVGVDRFYDGALPPRRINELARLGRSAIEWVPLAEEHAAVAAELAPLTMPYGLSLGDRACLALALTRREPAMTADRQWRRLDLDIRIELIR